MFGTNYNDLRQNRVRRVEQNEVVLQSLNAPPYAIGTWGLRSCAVVLVVSQRAAILAHISVSGSTNVMEQLTSLYTANRQLYFQDSERVWVVTGLTPDSAVHQAALDSLKHFIEARLAAIPGIQVAQDAHYTFHMMSGRESLEFADKGTVMVDARNDNIKVWIENRCIFQMARSNSSLQSQSTATAQSVRAESPADSKWIWFPEHRRHGRYVDGLWRWGPIQ